MTKVIVVGGGASGLVAAICAARKGSEVVILERNNALAKKILITGNGKCNYWNEDQNLEHYHSSSMECLQEVFSSGKQNEVVSFFENMGVVPSIKNGYYYPYSNQAVSIKAVLLNEIASLSISVKTEALVHKIFKKQNQFVVSTDQQDYFCDAVILATGSKATPKTGSDGNGYNLASSLGHSIFPVLPSLTSVYGVETYYKEWSGIRMNARLSLYEDNILKKEESGELQLTDYGLSGICIFNLSGMIARGLAQHKNEKILINFIPDLPVMSIDDFVLWLDERNQKLKKRTISQLFDGFIPYKLVYLFLRLAKIDSNASWNSLSEEKKLSFASFFLTYPFPVAKTSDFEKAQVCSGGVPLQEVNLQTMESKKVKGLYFCGEILDVDGDCGGYNLGFAWMSGMIAGENAGEQND